jgi:rhamnulose-1-phosphate aldolase
MVEYSYQGINNPEDYMDILKIPAISEFCRTAELIHSRGWAERNGGNISLLLDEDLGSLAPIRKLPVGCPGGLEGRYIAITGSGQYLRNVPRDPESNMGIFRICRDGVELLWGLKDGSGPSSELAAHLNCHSVRLNVDPAHRAVIHTHATNLVAMTFVHPLNDRDFTRTLWSLLTECIMFLPDGVAVLPWMPCGTEETGRATAEKMKESRIVVWAHHGVFSSGTSAEDALGLIEVAEKAAEIFLKISHLPILSKIDDSRLLDICKVMNIVPRNGYLSIPESPE